VEIIGIPSDKPDDRSLPPQQAAQSRCGVRRFPERDRTADELDRKLKTLGPCEKEADMLHPVCGKRSVGQGYVHVSSSITAKLLVSASPPRACSSSDTLAYLLHAHLLIVVTKFMARTGSPDAVIDVLKHSNLTDITLLRKVAQISRTDGQSMVCHYCFVRCKRLVRLRPRARVACFLLLSGRRRAICAVRASQKRLAAARGDSEVLQRCSM